MRVIDALAFASCVFLSAPLEDYLVIAVQNLELGQFSDPEFLARAKEEAKPFSLNEGEIKAVDVRLSKLVP